MLNSSALLHLLMMMMMIVMKTGIKPAGMLMDRINCDSSEKHNKSFFNEATFFLSNMECKQCRSTD